MHAQELQRRQSRADSEPWVIAETDGGYRIHGPTRGGRPYQVTGLPERPRCTCPDFQKHAQDPEWRCKHILAVENRFGTASGNGAARSSGNDITPPHMAAAPSEPEGRTGDTLMLLKRSVSPDGRIDSLSVEFSCPVAEGAERAVAQHAAHLLGLQAAIVTEFLEGDGRPAVPDVPRPVPVEQDGTLPAVLLRIGGADGKWGRRLFFTIQTDEGALRLYGSEKQLREHLKTAGYPAHAGNVQEDVSLDLPCRIETEEKENGFVTVTKVLPPAPGL